MNKLKNNPEKIKIKVNLINSGLGDLKEEIEDMIRRRKTNQKSKRKNRYC